MQRVMFLFFATAWIAGIAGAVPYVDEDFTGTTAPDWTFVTGQGTGPVLTAADGTDQDGDGWLRLTQDTTNQSSFVYYNNPIPTADGLAFTFDFVIWSKNSSNADGFTLAIFETGVTPDAGGYGGSLGYAQRSGVEGLAGGIAGFGFDEFGNFSNPTEGREGGPGSRPNSIAIRGSMGTDRSSGYEYQFGTSSLDDFSVVNAVTREDAVEHTVRITIPTSKKVSVEWKRQGQPWETLINEYPCTLNCPDQIRFGFTAGTGAVTSHHEIRHFSVAPVPEPTSLSLLGLAAAGALTRRRRRRAPRSR